MVHYSSRMNGQVGQVFWQVIWSQSKIVKASYCCEHAGFINKFVAPTSFHDTLAICLLEHDMILLAQTSPVVLSRVRPRSLTLGKSVWCDHQTEPDTIITRRYGQLCGPTSSS